MKRNGTSLPSLAADGLTRSAALELALDEAGLIRSGDIPIRVVAGDSLQFVWRDAVAYGLMVDSSLDGKKPTLWEVDSSAGFSSVIVYARVPLFAREVATPLLLIRGGHYFVSVYGAFPSYGIQEFVY